MTSLNLKPVSEQVIVVTGASSGIGLATAKMAAKQGAGVVVAARTEEALNKAVEEIRAEGGRAIPVVADVGRRDDMKRVADQAVEYFGRIDTWVNNAGVGIWGRIEEVSEADMRRLFDTNFWGSVHGSLVALPHLKPNGGALINVGSMVSDRAIPVQGIYSASKHAVKGFTDALRMELEEEGAPVSVTLIKPGSIGTTMPQHVRNYTNSEAKFPPPVYAPEDVAKIILRAASHPTRDAFVGGAARTISSLSKVMPRLLDLVSEKTLFKGQLGPKPPTPGDNLWRGRGEGEVRGDHQGSVIRPSLYSNSAVHPGMSAIAAGLTIAGIGWLMMRRRSAYPQDRIEASVRRARTDSRPAALETDAASLSSDAAPDDDFGHDSPSKSRISNGPNARPRDETISQSAPGIPDDTSAAVTPPEEEVRIADRIRRSDT